MAGVFYPLQENDFTKMITLEGVKEAREVSREFLRQYSFGNENEKQLLKEATRMAMNRCAMHEKGQKYGKKEVIEKIKKAYAKTYHRMR